MTEPERLDPSEPQAAMEATRVLEATAAGTGAGSDAGTGAALAANRAGGPKRVAVPTQLRIVAAAGLLVNLAWLAHALLSLSGSSWFFKLLGYGREQIDYFTDYPWLPAVFWALAIGGGFAGSIALLRSRASAVGLLAGSVLSQLVLLGLSLTLLDSGSVLGPLATGLAVVAIAIGSGLAGYAWWARRRGVLR